MTFEEKMDLTESEKIKFYIGAYKTADDEAVRKSGPKKSRKKNVEFEVTLSSALDMVLERTEGGITRKLILMPSQDKYVVMEGSVIQKIEDMTENLFLAFFNGFPTEGIDVNNIVFSKIMKDDASDIYNMITSERGSLHDGLMSHALFKKSSYITKLLKDNPKLWKLLATKTPLLSGSKKYGDGFLCTAKTFMDIKGYDITRYFVESYTKSSMVDIEGIGLGYNYRYSLGRYNVSNEKLVSLLNSISFDMKRLIEYLCFDLYAQGMETIKIGEYCDFIEMSMVYYENASKIPDKYPKALLTEHDIISLKYNELRKEMDERKFKLQYESFKKEMEIEDDLTLFKCDDVSILLPENPRDLVEEGQRLGHCVGTYVDRVSNGECLIVFGRQKDNLSESYLTIELRKRLNSVGEMTYEIAQVQGDNKRTLLTEQEIKILKKLMKEKHFLASNRNLT